MNAAIAVHASIGALRLATPLAYAAIGGALCERAGTVNIALEGELLAGAFAAALAGTAGLEWPAAVVAGLVAGAGVGLAHAVLTAGLRVDHVVSGIALNLFVSGFTKFELTNRFHSSSQSPRFAASLPSLGQLEVLPIVAPPLAIADRVWPSPGQLDLLVLAAPIAAIATALGLRHTVFGLRLRAAGESPIAAAAAGLRPAWLRALASILGGAIAATGGAWLAIDQHAFTSDMSQGRGYMALAAVILGRWHPAAAAAAALFFGAVDAAEIALENTGIVQIDPGLLHLAPFVTTLAVLAISRRSRPPEALGRELPP